MLQKLTLSNERRNKRLQTFRRQRGMAILSVTPAKELRATEDEMNAIFQPLPKLSSLSSNLLDVPLETKELANITSDVSLSRQNNVCASEITLQIANLSRKKSPANFNLLISAHAAEKNSKAAFRAHEWMVLCGVQENEETYYHLMRACASSGDHNSARNLITQISNEYDLPLPFYYELANSCVTAGELEKAYEVVEFSKENGLKPDAKLFNVIASGYYNVKDYKRVRELHDEMMIHYCDADGEMLNLLIKVCADTAEVERCLDTYNEFELTMLQPDITTFNEMIRCCGKSWKYNYKAFDLLDEMRSLAILPTAETYTNLIEACAIGGNVSKAKAIFQMMYRSPYSELKPTLDTYTAMMNVFASSQTPKKTPPNDRDIQKVPDEFIEIQKFPSFLGDDDGYGGYGEDGMEFFRDEERHGEWNLNKDFNEGTDLDDPDDHKDHQLSIFNAVTKMQEGNSKLEFSNALHQILDTKETDKIDSNESIDKHVDSEQKISFSEAVKRATHVGSNPTPVDSEIDYTRRNESEHKDIEHYHMNNLDLESLGEGNHWANTHEDNVEENAVMDDTDIETAKEHDIQSICLGTLQNQNIEEANLLFENMKREDIFPTDNFLTSYLRVFSEANRTKNALECLELFDSYNSASTIDVYDAIISMYSKIKKPNDALEWKNKSDQVDGTNLKSSTYGKLIHACTHHEMYDEALQLLEDLRLREIAPPNERYLKLLRTRCKELKIWTDNLPVNKGAWYRRMMVEAHKKRGSSRRNKLQNIRSWMRY